MCPGTANDIRRQRQLRPNAAFGLRQMFDQFPLIPSVTRPSTHFVGLSGTIVEGQVAEGIFKGNGTGREDGEAEEQGGKKVAARKAAQTSHVRMELDLLDVAGDGGCVPASFV